MVAIILLVSFLGTPESDLLFLGADLREIWFQSPDALAASTQSFWVLSGIPVSWQISGALFLFFAPFFRNNMDSWVPGDEWVLAWHVMLTITQHHKIPFIYRYQLLRQVLTTHREPPTNQDCGEALLCASNAMWTGCAEHSWVPENKSPELGYSFSHFQTLITQLNLGRFAKSWIVLNFSRSALQESDINC